MNDKPDEVRPGKSGELLSDHVPYPANVPGEFYVEDNCCTRCDVPARYAPELFGIQADGGSCYVKRQPFTEEEVDQIIEVIQCAELDCIRYRGKDRLIQLRIAELGQGHVCDSLPDDLRLIDEQVKAAWLTYSQSWRGRLLRAWQYNRLWLAWKVGKWRRRSTPPAVPPQE
jgi:hypothetical protein